MLLCLIYFLRFIFQVLSVWVRKRAQVQEAAIPNLWFVHENYHLVCEGIYSWCWELWYGITIVNTPFTPIWLIILWRHCLMSGKAYGKISIPIVFTVFREWSHPRSQNYKHLPSLEHSEIDQTRLPRVNLIVFISISKFRHFDFLSSPF